MASSRTLQIHAALAITALWLARGVLMPRHMLDLEETHVLLLLLERSQFPREREAAREPGSGRSGKLSVFAQHRAYHRAR
jgi:hypothetical protein